MWTLYVLGDALYIESLLNALAMLQNGGLLMQLAAVGLLVGVIATVSQGFQNEGRISIGPWFASLIVILMLFSTSTTVQIENMRTGTTRVVANVPLGPAAIASMISRLGRGLTETIESAFTTTSMTNNGFLSGLEALALLREATYNDEFLSLIDDPSNNGASYRKSLVNYVKDCTAKGIERGSLSIEDIRRAPDILEALKYVSPTRYTELQLGTASTTGHFLCGPAHDLIVMNMGAYRDSIKMNLRRMLAETDEEMANGGAATADATLDEASALISQSSVDSSDLVVGSVIGRMLELGAEKRYADDRLWGKAAMVQTSINTRVASWQAESSVFEHFFLPIMTFLEGLVFALAPFAAFGIGLGAKGMKVAGTYVVLAIWVQLWAPIMSIVNHFIMMVATGQMEALHTTAPFPSYNALTSMDGPLQTWIAVGSMLGSSIPFLSAAILFGGSQLIGQFGRQLSGTGAAGSSAHYTAPQVQNAAPVTHMKGGLSQQWDKAAGSQVAGVSDVTPTYDFKSQSQQQVSSSRQEVKGASERLGAAVGKTFSNQSALSDVAKVYAGRDFKKDKAQTDFDRHVESMTDHVMNSGSFEESDRGAVQGAVAMQLTAEFKPPGALGAAAKAFSAVTGISGSLKGSAGAKLSTERAEKLSTAIQEARKDEIAKSGGSEETLRQSVTSAAGDERSNALQEVIGRNATEDYSQAKEQYQQAQNAYQEASTRAQVYSASGAFDEATLVNQFRNAGMHSEVMRQAGNLGIAGAVQSLSHSLVSAGIYSSTADGREQADMAAFMRIASGNAGSRTPDGMNEENAQLAIDNLMRQSMGVGIATSTVEPFMDPEANRGIAPEAWAAGANAEVGAKANTGDVRSLTGDARQNFEDSPKTMEQFSEEARAGLAGQRNANNAEVDATTFTPARNTPELPAERSLERIAERSGDAEIEPSGKNELARTADDKVSGFFDGGLDKIDELINR